MLFWFHGSTLWAILNFEKAENLWQNLFWAFREEVQTVQLELCMYAGKVLPDMVAPNSKELDFLMLQVPSTSLDLLSCVESPFQVFLHNKE